MAGPETSDGAGRFGAADVRKQPAIASARDAIRRLEASRAARKRGFLDPLPTTAIPDIHCPVVITSLRLRSFTTVGRYSPCEGQDGIGPWASYSAQRCDEE